MIETPYKNVVFSMLSATGEPVADTTSHRLDAGGWVDYPIPTEVGIGGYEVLEVALDMTLVRSVCEFSAAVTGQWLPFLKTDADFKDASFHTMTFRGIRGSVKEDFPPAHLAVSPGMDLFRHTTHYRATYTADASFSGEVHHLAVSRTMLDQLVGAALAESLFAHLSIASLPSITVRAVPLHVSQLLVNAGSPMFTGQTRKLYCQAKLLEYLAALVQHVCGSPLGVPEANQQAKHRARDIHDKLRVGYHHYHRRSSRPREQPRKRFHPFFDQWGLR